MYIFAGSLRDLYGVTYANSYTLFSYYTQPDSANNYFHVTFTPSMIDSADYTGSEKASCIDMMSGEECLHTLRVTGDVTNATSEGQAAKDHDATTFQTIVISQIAL